MEEVAQLFGCNINEVVLLCFARLHADEIFTFFIIVFAKQLQEFKGSAICGDAKFIVEVLVS